MTDAEKTESAPEAMHSESAGQSQAKRATARKGGRVARTEAATKTVDAGVAGREGDHALASDPAPQPAPIPGVNRASVAPIDPITATPEVMDSKAKDSNPDATPPAVLHPNYEPVRYVDASGEEITSADGLFEPVGATKVRVTGRVSEVVPARNAVVPHRRLLFPMGAEIDKSVAEAFRAALGK